MIKYNKGIFGLNLLFRVHGSAIYRAVIPALLASGVYCAISYGWKIEQKSELLHPYAAGVLIGGITFLLVFRVTQSYGRYWEATGAVYKMQSKWMDGTYHISNYHMQSSQYDKIKPPSFAEHHYLNAHRLTRDRERVRAARASLGTSGKISDVRAQRKSIEPVNTDGDISNIIGMSVSGDDDNSNSLSNSNSQSPSLDFGVIPVFNNMVKNVVDTVVDTVEHVKPRRLLVSRISSRRFESAFHSSEEMSADSDEAESDDENGLRRMKADVVNKFMGYTPITVDKSPQFLTGRPRTDGNWGKLFEDGKSTYLQPDNITEIDVGGFASIQGGRTPILFLQELAHLASLLNAVAMSTLRNDIEGVSSPLSLYIPGSAWPEVDPKWDKNLYDSKLEYWLYTILYFLGEGRSPYERAMYNIARPLPVIGGVSDAEIQMLQMARGPLAKTQLCFGWLSEFAVREHGEGSHGALLSRCMQFLSDGMLAYNDCRKIMFNPFPFPFAQISSFFVNFMWILVPLLMDQYIHAQWLGISLSFFSVMCLQSIDEVAKELENPFRNIPNELPVVTYQAEFNEALITMYSGFHPDSFWRPPRELRKEKPLPPPSHDSFNMSTIREASSHGESESESGKTFNWRGEQSERSFQWKDELSGDDWDKGKINDQLRMIVEQQGRMMEQMMTEQKRLNQMMEKVFDQTIPQETSSSIENSTS